MRTKFANRTAASWGVNCHSLVYSISKYRISNNRFRLFTARRSRRSAQTSGSILRKWTRRPSESATNYRQRPARLKGDRVQQMAYGGTCLLSGIQKGGAAPTRLVRLWGLLGSLGGDGVFPPAPPKRCFPDGLTAWYSVSLHPTHSRWFPVEPPRGAWQTEPMCGAWSTALRVRAHVSQLWIKSQHNDVSNYLHFSSSLFIINDRSTANIDHGKVTQTLKEFLISSPWSF